MKKVEIALSGAQNSLAPVPHGISYRSIKTIKETVLGERIVEEVAKNLIKGIIPRVRQNRKVVMILKRGKDYEKTKKWRPMNLFDCIGKLGEEAVADVL